MELYVERLLGISERGLVFLSEECGLKCLPEVKEAFALLQADAAKHGFNLQACSAFRSFEAQARIVTAKFKGERKILDINEEPLSKVPEDVLERLKAILLFSAMPGFSRHHIGSDIDVFAADRITEGHSLQLTYHEYLYGSYFNEFGVYLNENIDRFGFSNPYLRGIKLDSNLSLDDKGVQLSKQISLKAQDLSQKIDNGQVALGPEPWHISFVRSADDYLQYFDADTALSYVESADLIFSPYVREVMTNERIDQMLQIAL